ncbi:helix-turn-helix transcriptional regulator [Bacillus sp. Bva_UNVM-123]|uniref:helix-turn-helix domain-containing protein n=1 Tax=Bacillus sp. Bva_UNVM-123 TaxID=2829798 RepID=UPI00391FC276
MDIGRRVLFIRKKKGVSQKELAKAIISVSHLSNLESGRYSVSIETLHLLSKRLEIPPSFLMNELKMNKEFINLLEKALDDIISSVEKGIETINSIPRQFEDLFYEISYYLLVGCLYYKSNKLEKAKLNEAENFPDLSSFIQIETTPEYFKKIYFYYKGIKNYRNNQLDASLNYYHQLIELSLSEQVKAGINYNLSLIYYKKLNLFKALKYADISLERYTDCGHWENVVALNNFLGGLYSEVNLYEDSLAHLNKALHLAEQLKLIKIVAMTYHNKGLLYKSQGILNLAIAEFNKSLKLKEKHKLPNVALTIFEIISVYTLLNKQTQVKSLLKKCATYISSDYENHKLQSLKADNELIEGREDHFVKLKEKSLEFFLEKGFVQDAIGINKSLGDYYFQRKKYKSAALYYKSELTIKSMKERVKYE